MTAVSMGLRAGYGCEHSERPGQGGLLDGCVAKLADEVAMAVNRPHRWPARLPLNCRGRRHSRNA